MFSDEFYELVKKYYPDAESIDLVADPTKVEYRISFRKCYHNDPLTVKYLEKKSEEKKKWWNK